MKIAIITGASSGMGREAARQLADCFSGLQEVWLIARRMDRMPGAGTDAADPGAVFRHRSDGCIPAGDAGKRAGGAQAQRKDFGKCFRLW